jgi:hypothetical protein
MLLLNFLKKNKRKKNKKNIGYYKTFPPELIRPIILYLKNDKKSLHSCLLVSRDWCKETVELLWRQPFNFLYTCNKINSSNLSRFITLKSNNQCYCSIEKRRYQATNLLMTYLLIKHDKEFVEKGIIKAKGEENIIFNYFEFLHVLDLHELYLAIKDWWYRSIRSKKSLLNSKFNETYDFILTVNSIMKYFFTNAPKLKALSLDTEFIFYKINNRHPCSFLVKVDYKYWDHHTFNLLIDDLETSQFFINLTELILIANEDKRQIFFALSQVCHNIQKLVIKIVYPIYSKYYPCTARSCIYKWDEINYLISLIRYQHNLVYFELFDISEKGMDEILKSLKESQHNSLKTLILNNVRINNNSIILSYLKYLQNLQELRFNKCICYRIVINNKYNKIDIIDEEKNYEEGLWLPNLKYLQVDYIDERGLEFEELSFILSSILIRCSPLLDSI